MIDNNYSDGFDLGFKQLKIQDVKEVSSELMKALSINNRVSLHSYRTGKREPKASQAVEIERIFTKKNITNIWGR